VSPRVLFVSKPIAPPWHDGSKNLVRDVAANLTRAEPTVMTTPGAPRIGPRVNQEAVYTDPGRFSPALLSNARVLRRLALGDPHDLWHFVFAPNPASSTAAQVARRVRSAAGWRGPVVQTVASAPRSFDTIQRWLFGDVVVVLSEWTRGRLLGSGVRGKTLRVIPPCAAAPETPDAARVEAVRARYDLRGPVVLYPGDLEVSRGAETVAEAAPRILKAVPDATIVFACRPKTSGAAAAKDELVRTLAGMRLEKQTRHVGEIDDMPALLTASSVVAFPVDDLYGKVDIPLVLLEAMSLGVPVIACKDGPLEALAPVRMVAPGDADALAEEVLRVLLSDDAAREAGEQGRALFTEKYRPQVVAAAYDDLYEELLDERGEFSRSRRGA
jgi:glycosyltransferase involved in cell wall biosynthesis